jgi:hypothetical protein
MYFVGHPPSEIISAFLCFLSQFWNILPRNFKKINVYLNAHKIVLVYSRKRQEASKQSKTDHTQDRNQS